MLKTAKIGRIHVKIMRKSWENHVNMVRIDIGKKKN
jgi:hypothetical protein